MAITVRSRVRARPGGLAFDVMIAALVTFLFSLVVFAPIMDQLKVAWGAGDLLSHYVNVDLWNGFGFATSSHYGFPGGMNQNLFPGIDITQNTIASTLSGLFGDPFIGLNLLAIASFPITAVMAVVAFRLVGLTGWWAIALSVSYTFVPYHWGRLLGHTYLGTMYAAATGVILALLIGQGRLAPGRANRKFWWLAAAMVLTTAWSNVYYAAFGLLLMFVALIVRIIRGDHLSRLVLGSTPFFATITLVLVGFVPSLLARSSEAGAGELGSRFSYESVTLAGSLAMLLLPAPVSQLPYMGYYNEAVRGLITDAPPLENVSETNFGTWVLLAAIVYMIVWWIGTKRHGSSTPPDLRLVMTLLVVTLLFFIPWGLNALVAEFISAQIRAWNRLVPTLALLILLSAAVALRRSRWNRGAWSLAGPGAVLLIVLIEQVIPYRATYMNTVSTFAKDTAWAQEYAVATNQAIPQDCGIVQFPAMIYPENGTVPPELNDYEHFWLPLMNRQKDFSYGAVRFSEAAKITEDLEVPLTRDSIDRLTSLGFCGVHIDFRGFDRQDRLRISMNAEQWLGPAVATGRDGDWVLYRLPL